MRTPSPPGYSARCSAAQAGAPRWLLASALSLFLFAPPASAATGLTAGSGAGVPGGALLIPISLNSDASVAALQFDLAAASSLLVSDGAVAANQSAGLRVLSREVSPGIRRVLVYRTDGLPLPGGELVSIPFLIAANASPGTIPLKLDNVVLSDLQFGRLPADQAAGAVTIASGETIEFRSVRFDEAGAFQLELRASAGRQIRIEVSSDLKSWTLLTTESAAGGAVRIVDANSGGAATRYYRASAAP